ncbi:sensor domain-containing protein [Paenibacillus chitinolyticus]|uniref:sensor domain-containing protein n=1 Tax=Paenibacillus chitinolyticus TaxID=79263 RepID=UPI002DBBA4E9|nr:sensor domain-containing protein [Paenibacillus chitinolyticus]MEC0245843.1 sensor domain-containing protein [Paenibacillus chitinolyticus]
MKKEMMQSLQDFYFLLLTFVTGVFYFCFYLVSLVFSLSMAFTLVGLPMITYVMRSTRTFARYERIQTKIYTDLSIEPYELPEKSEGSVWRQAKEELADRRNWTIIGWLMLKFPLGLLALLLAVLCYIAPVIFILIPLAVPYMDLYFAGIPVDTFAKSLFVMAGGVLLAYAGAKLGRSSALLAGRYIRQMFERLHA